MGIFQKVPVPLVSGLQGTGRVHREEAEVEIIRYQRVSRDIMYLGKPGYVAGQAFD
jgi:hypothetical protein